MNVEYGLGNANNIEDEGKEKEKISEHVPYLCFV